MYEYSGSSINSAKAASELSKKRDDEAKVKEAITNKNFQLASQQIELLNKANEFSLKAHAEAQESRVESEKSLRRALWSNIISGVSLVVAIASLVVAYVSSNT